MEKILNNGDTDDVIIRNNTSMFFPNDVHIRQSSNVIIIEDLKGFIKKLKKFL